MGDKSLKQLTDFKKSIIEKKEKIKNQEKLIKKLNIDKNDLSFIGHYGLKKMLIIHSITLTFKIIIFSFLLYSIRVNSTIFNHLNDNNFFMFASFTILFSHLIDFLHKKFMIYFKNKKLVDLNKNIEIINNEIKIINDDYFDHLINFDITKYQDNFTKFNSLSVIEKEIIKEYIDFINSDDAKFFNLVKNETQKNLIGMKNY